MLNQDGRYLISVAARFLSLHPCTLRKYERLGLIKLAWRGPLRLYSDMDLDRVRLIRALQQRGLNLAGVRLVMEMRDRLLSLRVQCGEVHPALELVDEMLQKLSESNIGVRSADADSAN